MTTKIKRYTKAYYKAIDQAKVEARISGETRIVAETVYGVHVGSTREYGGCVMGMYRTFVRPDGSIQMAG